MNRVKFCLTCNKRLNPGSKHFKRNKYCSQKCFFDKNKVSNKTKCSACGKILYRAPERRGRLKQAFCSLRCMGIFLKKRVYIYCSYCGKKIERTPSEVINNKNSFCNRKCKHLFFNKDKTKLQRKIRDLSEYKEWRNKIFKRDHYKCQKCNTNGYIYAHHKLSLSNMIMKYKIKVAKETLQYEDFWDINNGQTLCEEHHKQTDNYGNFKKQRNGRTGEYLLNYIPQEYRFTELSLEQKEKLNKKLPTMKIGKCLKMF